MPNNLSGTNISDTYQKLVQVENGVVSDGTGSILPLSFNSDGVTITGTLHATSVSSSRVTSSVIYTSGSSTFGDQASDTHTFLGAVTASGNISSSGNLYAEKLILPVGGMVVSPDGLEHLSLNQQQATLYVGGGMVLSANYGQGIILNDGGNSNNDFRVEGGGDTHLIFVDAGADKVAIGTNTVSDSLLTVDGDLRTTHITASGNISASSTSYIQIPELRGTGTGTTQLNVQGQISASGNISASGAIIGDSINVLSDSATTGYKLYQPSTAGTLQLSAADGGGFTKFYVKATTTEVLSLEVNGNTTIGTAPNGSQPTDDTISIHSVINNSITASGNISSSGIIYGTSFIGNGRIFPGYNVSTNHFLDKTTVNNPILRAVGGFNVVGNVTASGDINTTGIYKVDGVNAIDYTNATHLFGSNSSFTKLRSTKGIEMTSPVTASNNISASGNVYANSIHVGPNGGEFIDTYPGSQQLQLNVNNSAKVAINSNTFQSNVDINILGDLNTQGNISASSNIRATGTITASQVYESTLYQWETTARADTDDDDNWQGPNGYGIHTRADWNNDYGTLYSTASADTTIEASRLVMNTGWRIPHSANYSCSIKSFEVYVGHNTNQNSINADSVFSCSLWYSKNSDLAGELNVLGGTSGTFTQRHAATINSLQFKSAGDSLFKYNNYHVSQSSLNLNLAPGSMIYPRIKTEGTHKFTTNIYWIVNYTKTPL